MSTLKPTNESFKCKYYCTWSQVCECGGSDMLKSKFDASTKRKKIKRVAHTGRIFECPVCLAANL